MIANKPNFKIPIPDNITDGQPFIEWVNEMNNRQFSPASLGISGRVLSHWKRQGLLPVDQKRQWVKLNLIEYVWLSIVRDLRQLGCSLPLIQIGRERMFSRLPILEEISKNPEMKKKAFDLMDKNALSVDEKKGVESALESGNLKDVVEEFSFDRPIVMLIIDAILVRGKCGILITLDKDVIPWTDQQIQIDSRSKQLFDKPHIFIPIQNYLIQFIKEEDKSKFLVDYQILSEDEMMVLRAIRTGEFKEIVVKPVKGNDAVGNVEIITVKDGHLTEKEQEQITKILGLKNYQSITLKKRSNSQIYFERQHRK